MSPAEYTIYIHRTYVYIVGLARTIYIHIYGVYTEFLAGKSPKIRSYMVLANPMYICMVANL